MGSGSSPSHSLSTMSSILAKALLLLIATVQVP